jgi:hypothetical protein
MKLKSKQEQTEAQLEATRQAQISRQQSQQEFQSVEELLRADARQVTPPERIARRLKQTLAAESARARSWWRRLIKPKNHGKTTPRQEKTP